MSRVVVIEDEPPAQQRLIAALRELEPGMEVAAVLTSVAESIRWFEAHTLPDLIFADVQLADGSALEIFDHVVPSCPIIFCTAYDAYLLDALSQNGIAYLLKPYSKTQLADAIGKYRRLESHFSTRLAALARALRPTEPTRRRMFARDGDRVIALPIAQIAYFAVTGGLTELVCGDGRRLGCDRTLAEVEAELGDAPFFRINRQVLAHADAVAGFRPYVKGRLLVELQPPAQQTVVVSQPNAARFRTWLQGRDA